MGDTDNENNEVQQHPAVQNEMINESGIEEGPTDDGTLNFALPIVRNVSIPQFFMRVQGQSHACNVALIATMEELMDIAEQVCGAPRSQITLKMSTATSQKILSDIGSVIEFGFSPGCTIDVSILGPGGSDEDNYDGEWGPAPLDVEFDDGDDDGESDEKLLEQNVEFDDDDDDESDEKLLEQNKRGHKSTNSFLTLAIVNFLTDEDDEMPLHHVENDCSGRDKSAAFKEMLEKKRDKNGFPIKLYVSDPKDYAKNALVERFHRRSMVV